MIVFDSLIAAGNSFQIVGAEKLKEQVLGSVFGFGNLLYIAPHFTRSPAVAGMADRTAP